MPISREGNVPLPETTMHPHQFEEVLEFIETSAETAAEGLEDFAADQAQIDLYRRAIIKVEAEETSASPIPSLTLRSALAGITLGSLERRENWMVLARDIVNKRLVNLDLTIDTQLIGRVVEAIVIAKQEFPVPDISEFSVYDRRLMAQLGMVREHIQRGERQNDPEALRLELLVMCSIISSIRDLKVRQILLEEIEARFVR